MRSILLFETLRRLALAACLLPCSDMAQARELVMVETTGCPWCLLWQREIGPIYPLTTEGKRFPLRRIDLSDARAVAGLATPVSVTPTFLVVACGREIGRITGYPGEDFFWSLLADAFRVADRAAASC